MFVIPLMELAMEQAEALGLDPDRFRAFYEEALPKIYGYFLHRCGGSVPVAEDLTQETFLASVVELRKGRRPDQPLPWIFGIARHKLLDHYRRAQRQPRHVGGPDVLDELALEEGNDETRTRTIAALAAVPAAQRAALVLCYLGGFTMAEAGALLGRTAKAIEGLLGRGSETFRRAYAETAA